MKTITCRFLLALLAAAPLAQAQYAFTLIADSSSPTFQDFGGTTYTPALNTGERVAFYATVKASAGGGSGIFTGNGGPTTAIALTSGPTFSSFGRSPSINTAGTVAFAASLKSSIGGLFTSDGGAATTIQVDGDSTYGGGIPSINTAGMVAFTAALNAGGSGVFIGNGGVKTAIVLSSEPTFSLFDINLQVNAAGTVAFLGYLDAGGNGIFTGNGGATTTIALSNGPTFSAFFAPSINAAGTVAFKANLDAGGSGIFTGNGGATTPIALSSGPIFSSFKYTSINAVGSVAFIGGLDSGEDGIYVVEGGVTKKIIATGDTFHGSTVRDLYFGPGGLNDLGQVAFRYSLFDGTSGIAVATAPEPGSALLAALGTIGLLARRRGGQRGLSGAS